MKILLIFPPNVHVIEPFKSAKQMPPPIVIGFPLGLAYLASVLEAHNHEVNLLDACYDNLDMTQITHKISDFKPDVVGISVYTPLAKTAVEIARIAKLYGARVIGGGPHATFDAQNLLDNYDFDHIVKGEGETAFLDLVEGRTKDKIIEYPFNKDLDSLPLPAYHLVDFKRYIVPQLLPNAVSIMSSRGCSHHCAFCCQLQGRWRTRSPQNIISEIKYLLNKYDSIKSLQFYDDNFSYSKERVFELCELLIKHNFNKYMWSCQVRVDQITKEMLLIMKRAGCVKVSYGVESGSPVIQKSIHKGISLDRVKEAFKMTKKVGIERLAYFMIGNPGETCDTIKQSIRFAKRLKSTSTLWIIAQVYPGTELAKKSPPIDYVKYLYQPEVERTSSFTHPCVPVFEQEGLDRETLKKLQKKILRQFLIHHSIQNFWVYVRHFLQSPLNALRYWRLLYND
jgi:radical SAM superfamily enzyme YgiQ (UPF0313 family)